MTTPNYRPKYLKLERIAPYTHDYNFVVKVLEKKVIVDKTAKDGKRVRQEDVLVGDETGCAYVNAHDDQCEKLVVGKVLALDKVRVKLIGKYMRLSMDKWSSIKETPIAIPGEIATDYNLSERVYDGMKAGS